VVNDTRSKLQEGAAGRSSGLQKRKAAADQPLTYRKGSHTVSALTSLLSHLALSLSIDRPNRKSKGKRGKLMQCIEVSLVGHKTRTGDGAYPETVR
jgi:hypothetical protein